MVWEAKNQKKGAKVCCSGLYLPQFSFTHSQKSYHSLTGNKGLDWTSNLLPQAYYSV